jgi:hypothetical protein
MMNQPNTDDLARVREEFAKDTSPLNYLVFIERVDVLCARSQSGVATASALKPWRMVSTTHSSRFMARTAASTRPRPLATTRT